MSAEASAAAVAAAALVCARRAAERCGVTVVELSDVVGQRAAAALLARVWRVGSGDALVSPALIRALEFSGNYVAGAVRNERLVGVAVGFRGAGYLHSDLVGVERGAQGGGVGYALKLHQRGWALGRGFTEVGWTFDPLMSRNAYFNLQKLGASVVEYLPDFYGPLDDSFNAEDATDRLYVRWRLDSPRVVAACQDQAAEVNPVQVGVLVGRAGDAPVSGGAKSDPVLLVAVPADIESLRVRAPRLAVRWRYAVRAALGGALAQGYRITGFIPDGCSYVLTREK